MTDMHRQLVAAWCAETGGKSKGWGKAVLAELRRLNVDLTGDNGELLIAMRRFIPDGWLVRENEHGGVDVELLEAVVYAEISPAKYRALCEFYWQLDYVEVGVHLHVMTPPMHIQQVDLFERWYWEVRDELASPQD